MWYRWRIEMESGAAFLSPSSYNKPQFAFQGALNEVFDKMKFGTVVAIIVHECKA